MANKPTHGYSKSRQIVIDTLIDSKDFLNNRQPLRTDDPLETTIDLLYNVPPLPNSTSKPHPPPSHLTTDDPLEQTMDLLYHGISNQSISRPRATPQQLDARRLEKLHKHIRTIITTTIQKKEVEQQEEEEEEEEDSLETTTELLYGALHENNSSVINNVSNQQPGQRLAISCCTTSEFNKWYNNTQNLSKKQLQNTTLISITKSQKAKQENRISISKMVFSFSYFTTLDTLVLRGLLLTDLPSEIEVLAPTLRTFVGSYNSFRTWPNVLSNLTQLTSLDLSHNRLETPPEFNIGSLQQLETLNLSNNKLIAMPSEIVFLRQTLKNLYLDRNCLQHIPKSIAKMKQLSVLTLFGNLYINEWDRKWSKESLIALQNELYNMNTLNKTQNKTKQNLLLARRNSRKNQKNKQNKKLNRKKSTETEESVGDLDLMHIKRGKLTGVWDLRPKRNDIDNDNSIRRDRYDRNSNLQIASEYFKHVDNIREVLCFHDQLPFLVDYGGELSSLWKLIFQMQDLMVLWIFPNDYNKDLSTLLGSISRQLGLAFNLINQIKTVKKGKECWKFVLVYRYKSDKNKGDLCST